MKRRIVSSMLCVVMMAVCVLSLSMTAKADNTHTYQDTGTYNPTTTSASQDSPDTPDQEAEFPIDVQARVTGDAEIIYYVQVQWGDMKFEYNYGQTWDPAQHKYVTPSGGSSSAGWNKSYIADANNFITVTNDSNFPVTAEFNYAHDDPNVFNDNPDTTLNAVKGTFGTSNTAANTGLQALADLGQTNTQSITSSYTMRLNTVTTALEDGDTYYYHTGYETEPAENTVYFTLVGVPDNSRVNTLRTFAKRGTITVTIAPSLATTQATKS